MAHGMSFVSQLGSPHLLRPIANFQAQLLSHPAFYARFLALVPRQTSRLNRDVFLKPLLAYARRNNHGSSGYSSSSPAPEPIEMNGCSLPNTIAIIRDRRGNPVSNTERNRADCGERAKGAVVADYCTPIVTVTWNESPKTDDPSSKLD